MDLSFTEFMRTVSGSQIPRETFILLVNKYLQEHALLSWPVGNGNSPSSNGGGVAKESKRGACGKRRTNARRRLTEWVEFIT